MLKWGAQPGNHPERSCGVTAVERAKRAEIHGSILLETLKVAERSGNWK